MCFSERKDDINDIINYQNKELSNGLDKNDTVKRVLNTMAICIKKKVHLGKNWSKMIILKRKIFFFGHFGHFSKNSREI